MQSAMKHTDFTLVSPIPSATNQRNLNSFLNRMTTTTKKVPEANIGLNIHSAIQNNNYHPIGTPGMNFFDIASPPFNSRYTPTLDGTTPLPYSLGRKRLITPTVIDVNKQ